MVSLDNCFGNKSSSSFVVLLGLVLLVMLLMIMLLLVAVVAVDVAAEGC